MRNGWKQVHFGDCVTMLSGGTPSKANDLYWKGDIPWVSCKDMKTERIFDAEDHLSEEGAANGTRMVSPGTVLIVVRGMILANEFPVAIAKRPVAFNQDLKALKCAPCLNDQYLFYWLKARTYEILGIADEAAHGTKRLQTERLQGLEIDLPPRHLQAAIISVLSSYDDLIENNSRRIKILEQMAEMIYREWFVNFRFPGHEKVPLVESDLGLIPKGWTVSTIGAAVQILGGGTPSTTVPEYWDSGDLAWYSPSDLTATGTMFMSDSSKHITRLGLEKSSARLFPANSVMVTSRATIGVVAINTGQACTNQGFITCIPDDRVSTYQVYFWLLQNKPKIVSLATGATFKEINKATFRQLPIVVATQPIADAFVQAVSPLGGLIGNLIRRNSLLRTTRDLLLPKLISGEIPVEAADDAAAQLLKQAAQTA